MEVTMSPADQRGSGVAVIVASAGRPALLLPLLRDLAAQTLLPTEVMLSVPTPADLPPVDALESIQLCVRIVFAPRGLTAQRNVAMDCLQSNPRWIAFFDDDARVHVAYLNRATYHLSTHPNVVAITGSVLRDGVREKRPIDEATADAILCAAVTPDASAEETRELYGCNFVVRASAAIASRFDERLPLYGWLEDRDFAARVSRHGELHRIKSAQIVHLGWVSGGRLSHLRFGYSQIANPLYLRSRGSLAWRDVLHAMRGVPSNLVYSLAGPDASWRRQRLRGNAEAFRDLVRGRLRPERVRELHD
jgi:hypothetical protein